MLRLFFDKYPAVNVSFGIHGCQCKQALRRWYDLIFSDIFTSSLLSDFNRFYLCKLEVTFAIDPRHIFRQYGIIITEANLSLPQLTILPCPACFLHKYRDSRIKCPMYPEHKHSIRPKTKRQRFHTRIIEYESAILADLPDSAGRIILIELANQRIQRGLFGR